MVKATRCGLGKWYEKKFEKLGWMVLAEKRGDTEKLKSYKHSVMKLHEAIVERMNANVDSKGEMYDLAIMKENVETLLAHINKDFPQAGGARKGSRRRSKSKRTN